MKKIQNKFPYILLSLYSVLFIITAINPYDRLTWFIENLPVVLVVLGLALTYRKFRFSNLSYFLMFFWIVMHTIGGHYTFERVPFDFVTDLFGFARNHFDRFGHFMIGFFAVPFAELVYRTKKVPSFKTSLLFGLFAIGFVAAGYEIIEFSYAVIFGGDSAQNFLGSQGDFWDAQWDMLMDISGAIISLLVYTCIHYFKKNTAM